MSRAYPECGHPREKGDQHRRCVECLGRAHAEAALLEEDISCRACSLMPLARVRKRLARWVTSPTDTEEVADADMLSPPAEPEPEPEPRETASIGPSRPASRATVTQRSGASTAGHVPPVSLPRDFPQESEAVFHFGFDSDDEFAEELLDNESDSDLPSGQVEPMDSSAQATSKTLGAELHELSQRAANKLGIPTSTPPVQEASLLDGEYFSAPPTRGPAPVPLFLDVHKELTKFWANPYSARSPVRGFDAYMDVDQAKELGYLDFPPVEDAVASYLAPAAPTMRLGRKPVLPTRAGKQQTALTEKAYLAAGQAACALNTQALLQRYQSKLLTELAVSSCDCELVTELRKATDLSLRLTRCSAQAIGRNMGALVASQRYLWLSLSRLSDTEKSPLLDAPVSPRGIFGEAVTLMTAKFETDMKNREALQAWIPRSTQQTGQRSFRASAPRPQPPKREAGAESPAPPPKVSTPRGWNRHTFRPPQQPPPQQQQPLRRRDSRPMPRARQSSSERPTQP